MSILTFVQSTQVFHDNLLNANEVAYKRNGMLFNKYTCPIRIYAIKSLMLRLGGLERESSNGTLIRKIGI